MNERMLQSIAELIMAREGDRLEFSCGLRKRVVFLDRIAGGMFGTLVNRVSELLGEAGPQGRAVSAISENTALISTFIVENACKISQEFLTFHQSTGQDLLDYSRFWVMNADLSGFEGRAAIVAEGFDIYIQQGLASLEAYERSVRESSLYPVTSFELLVEIFDSCAWWWRAMDPARKENLN